ncbi:MAG: hypothetical protein ABSD74_04490 [Rhizomicrobium sp.]
MNDDLPDERSGYAPSNAAPNPAALDAAVAAAGADSEDARDFLRRQSQLTDVQTEVLRELHAFELSHLRWRRFGDRMKGAFQILLVVLGVLLLIVIGAVVWNASRSNGLVIDAFTVPPDLAARGITGQVVADKMLDDLDVLQKTSRSTLTPANVTNDWTNDIRVEIPETGISLGEAYRLLRNWLGNDRHLSGAVYETDGGLALMSKLNGTATETFQGRRGELDLLVRKVAEAMFGAAEPYRYAVYLLPRGKFAESEAILRKIALDPDPDKRGQAYRTLATSAWLQGRYDEADAWARRAQAAMPDSPTPPGYIVMVARTRSHLETALAAQRLIHDAGSYRADENAHTMAMLRADDQQYGSWLVGDYDSAISRLQRIAESGALFTGPDDLATAAGDAVLAHDAPRANALLAEWRMEETEKKSTESDNAYALLADMHEDWRAELAALADWQSMDIREEADSPGVTLGQEAITIRIRPLRALVYARLGEFRHAEAEIDATPLDCDACVRTRGDIRAIEKNWSAAAFWFARAVNQAPDIPVAWSDWGAMLLQKGDYDGAIAKFTLAHSKGPRFADPLEMWGEALMQENRSDLALAKFEEAGKYAPNWGRLHLEWGKALFYAGKKGDAKKQFEKAASLDLSSSDKVSLTKWIAGHG